MTSIRQTVEQGFRSMPPVAVPESRMRGLLDFLSSVSTTAAKPGAGFEWQSVWMGRVTDQHGYPGVKPPWGTLNAINLRTGRIEWKVPLGEYEELTRAGVPVTGTENFGATIFTAGGIIFCAGTPDRKIRAFDSTTGARLWEYKLPFAAYAQPATYEVNGRQYIVIAAAGGGKLGSAAGDAYVAFSLPAM
jgi:quinoprotein glucose dehydrogenase